MESVGFKEWALVCEALGRGEQTLILRKGGIAEGRDGFAFRHRQFFLLPTFFHEQVERVRAPGAQLPTERADAIEVRYLAKVEGVRFVTKWENAAALEPLHILAESVVHERFKYDDAQGIHVAFVRAFRLQPRWIFPDAPKYGGCRSWVNLPESPPSITLEPVLSDAEHEAQRERFQAALV